MSRSTWKLKYISKSCLSLKSRKLLLETGKQDKNMSIKIWDRSSIVNKLYLGKLLQIYNGKVFVFRRIRSTKMFGGKFGELSRCTKRARKTVVGGQKSFKKENLIRWSKKTGKIKKKFIHKRRMKKKFK